MFDPTSRYAKLPLLVHPAPDGAAITYVARRFVPSGDSLTVLAEAAVQSEDRPDLLTARTLGDPLAFWRVADANDVMDPGELVEEPGRTVRIPVPQP
jgi:hypothetical protein